MKKLVSVLVVLKQIKKHSEKIIDTSFLYDRRIKSVITDMIAKNNEPY